MSGFGGFGGFGQQQQQQQQQSTGGFGGFGSTTTPTTGFGATGTGFGAAPATTGGGLFGGGGTTGGFGGAFGSTSGGAFGAAKPSAFGAQTTTSGGMFGSGTATSGSTGFGGFGTAPAATTSAFGGGSSGGMFGGQKSGGFGTTSTSQPNPFGGAATSSPFGGTTGAFGAPASTALSSALPDCQGTGSVPFNAFVEKEPNSSTNQQNSFQSISFQTPYAKFSPEELRLADYTQGRKYGNANGQPGAFGTTSSFGGGFGTSQPASSGFGSTATAGGGLFGGGSTSSTFGTAQPAQTGFGQSPSTGGGLFGSAPKPAGGGLFGAAAPAQSSGGLFGGGGFGTSAPATGGFGQPASSAAGSSLFGATASQTANKPFSFSTAGPAATGSAFGGAAPASTGFGTGGGGLFGNTQQQQQATPFGQQPATASAFGGFGGAPQQTQTSSLFGAQPKSAGGLFGAQPAATTTSSLFGNSQQAATNANPFGTSSQNTGGLFGTPKPATGGLLGNTPQNQGTSSGGLFGGTSFGNNQNQGQQQNTGGLFGGLGTNNQQKPSLFGAPLQQQQAGSSLFGNSGNQQQNSLFGNNNNQQQQQQQQPQNSLFGGGNSLFGNSQQQSGQQSLSTSINDNNSFGSLNMFQGLQSSQNNNPGPLATPLSSSTNRQKRVAAIPIARLSSASSPHFATPQRKGYGFSYSTYASPGSASSTASTPGSFSNSTLGSGLNFSRSLKGSMSQSGLRNSFTQDSILAPGAFSASSSARSFNSIGSGSVKKLNIQRNLRTDLFSPPSQNPAPASDLRKKCVSFDSATMLNGSSNSTEIVRTNGDPSPQDMGFLRPHTNSKGTRSSNSSSPEMEQVKNNELAIVQEETPVIKSSRSSSSDDSMPVDYSMKPTISEIKAMTREQRSKVDLTVTRKAVSSIHFDKPVDLTNINPAEIPGNIVVLETRQTTVYPLTMIKPQRGTGLNVPATIKMEDSFPRRGGKVVLENNQPRIAKHIKGLKNVKDTHFIDYEHSSGIWTFRVDHFTTYSYPEENDEDDDDAFGQSTLSLPPDTPTPKVRTPGSQEIDQSFASTSQLSRSESDPDDTFEFRKRKVLPGAFDEREIFDDEAEEQQQYGDEDQESFLDERSVSSQSENGVEPMDEDDASHEDESVSIVDQEMMGSYPEVDNTAELDVESENEEDLAETPGALVRARLRAAKSSATPRKFAAGDDWTNALKNTVSPKKQDRALLKSMIDVHGNDSRADTLAVPVQRRVFSGGFANSIDVMHSLFGPSKSQLKTAKVSAAGKGFEWPYAKKAKTGGEIQLESVERDFHESLKPSWGPDGTLVYSALPTAKSFGQSSRRKSQKDGLLEVQKGAIVSEKRDVLFAKFSNEAAADALIKHKSLTVIDTSGAIPSANLLGSVTFANFIDDRNLRDPAAHHEKLIWHLASILWDDVVVPEELVGQPRTLTKLRKENLSTFWQNLVIDASTTNVALARSNEEKAIALLSGYKVADACAQLIQGKDFHLATLVALIGVKPSIRVDIQEQLKSWKESKLLSEFSQPVRAIYELLAGNVCVCEGSKGSIEDRVDSFVISKRFGLDWRQAFGLRLWYGTQTGDSLEKAIEQYADDIYQGKETSQPAAWYIEQKIPALWNDEATDEREDLLWGLMKLASFDNVDMASILRPENSQLSPLDIRLSWQLSQMLFMSGVVKLEAEAEERSDQLTLSFAFQLTNEGSWLDAVFVLLHLMSEEARSKSLQTHLSQHAGRIGSEDSESFKTLVETYKIPTSWIWDAKALYLRSIQKDYCGEVQCLIKARSFVEAHKTFSQNVAPQTIVEMDYDTLRSLLRSFGPHKESIPEWHLGGQIYQDFLELLDCQKRAKWVDIPTLERLLAGLPAVIETSRNPGFMEGVAIETISAVVARAVFSMNKIGETVSMNKILRLPLTEDKYLQHTVEMSLEYYRGVMASAR